MEFQTVDVMCTQLTDSDANEITIVSIMILFERFVWFSKDQNTLTAQKNSIY